MTSERSVSGRGVTVWAAFIGLSLAWGSSYLFIRIGVRHLAPLPLVAGRLLVGAITLSGIVLARRQTVRLPARALFTLFFIAAVNTTTPFFLIAWGEQSVSSGMASVLNSTVPIFSVVMAALVLHDEPFSLPRVGGAVVGFVGVLLLLSRDLGGGLHWVALGGQLAILLSSVCYAIGPVATRRALRGVPSLTLAFYIVWMSAIQTLVLTIFISRPDLGTLNRDSVIAVLWLGVLGSGIAYTLAYFILDRWGASRYSLVAYMMPISGLTLGAIFLAESIDWRIVAGSLLVFTGIFLASMAKKDREAAASMQISHPVATTSTDRT